MPFDRAHPQAVIAALVHNGANQYRDAGRFARKFARGKLAHDPVFVAFLTHGLIPQGARVLDLGCGQGLLAAWLMAASALAAQGRWPKEWPLPPEIHSFHGIEWMLRDVERADAALRGWARFSCADISQAAFEPADVITIIDVLHYIDFEAQQRALAHARAALRPGGRLLLRVGDAGAGWPFRLSRSVDTLVIALRGLGWRRLHCRPVSAWRHALEQLGFVVDVLPMSAGTPFANVLLVAHVPAQGDRDPHISSPMGLC